MRNPFLQSFVFIINSYKKLCILSLFSIEIKTISAFYYANYPFKIFLLCHIMAEDFTHLHLHTTYSMLDGAIRISDL